MDNYWKEHFNQNALKFPDSPLKQVQATVNGEALDALQCSLMTGAIVSNLQLKADDRVVDLCCGNGYFTQQIASRCAFVDGVDFSEVLIQNARLHYASSNITYHVGDVGALDDSLLQKASKVYMCYALQHLEVDSVERLLSQIARTPGCSRVFISGIPDLENIRRFYDTDEKMAFHQQRLAEGRPHIGHWWSWGDLEALARRAGLVPERITQPQEQFSSHYRFDCVLLK